MSSYFLIRFLYVKCRKEPGVCVSASYEGTSGSSDYYMNPSKIRISKHNYDNYGITNILASNTVIEHLYERG